MSKKIVHYANKKISIDKEITDKYIKLSKQLAKIEKELKPLEKQLKEELLVTMELLEKTDCTINGIVAKYKKGYVQNKLDTDRLKTDNLELYTKYLKTINVKSSLSINIEN